MTSQPDHPLRLPIAHARLRHFAERVSALRGLAEIYDSWVASPRQMDRTVVEQLLDFVLQRLEAKLVWAGDGLPEVPSGKPLIVVANHPMGGLEGMLLTRELLRLRPDVRVLANSLLLRVPEFRGVFIGVDVLRADAVAENGAGIREACRHLGAGGALLVFPAGTVSRLRPLTGRIEDAPWSNFIGRLALRYGADCLPVHVSGRNRLRFYFAGYLHARLRTALLPGELLSRRNRQVEARAGDLLTAGEVAALADATAITQCLRFTCDALAPALPAAAKAQSRRKARMIAEDVSTSRLVMKHAELAEYQLRETREYAVYCAPHAKLGCIMQQIAIEREKTFRAVDEGTGKELDSDHFDPYYWHLWVWHRQRHEIVGGYRIVRSDELMRQQGISKLYSHSLYRFDANFVLSLGRALEVGRSFVTIPYQRHAKVLDLLWQGIGAFVMANPGYHTLFGCVSISSQYSMLARAFLADALMANFGVNDGRRERVQPRVHLHARTRPWTPELLAALGNTAIINKLLGNLDNGRRIPILLRHYLALNGRFASFAVNRGFNDSLDGLIIVDLRDAPARYLNRYMGETGARALLSWSTECDERAA